MTKILEIKNLYKKFGSEIALDNINLSMNQGEVIGLIGGNGAGKTTLSEVVAGITKPTSGSIKYNLGKNANHKEKIGIQFQDSSYPSGLSVKDLVSFARNLHKIKMDNFELKRLLQKFQMGDIYRRKVRSLSGGQRQKINVLLSIIHKPKIVILDELTTGLDILAREEVIDFTKKLIDDQSISVIIVSHQMDEIKALASRVVVLSNGKIVKDEPIASIEKTHKSLSKYMLELISSNQRQITDEDILATSWIFTSPQKNFRMFWELFKKLGWKRFVKLFKMNYKNQKKNGKVQK